MKPQPDFDYIKVKGENHFMWEGVQMNTKLPDSIYIKHTPWWKFWLWFRNRTVVIPMIKQLTGKPVFYEPSISCTHCLDGQKSFYTGHVGMNDDKHIQCPLCGKIRVFNETA